MSVELLYRCLDPVVAASVLVEDLARAIANLFDIEVVHLHFEVPLTPPWVAHRSSLAGLDHGLFKSHGEHPCIYTKLTQTPFQSFHEAGLQAIAYLPIAPQGQAKGWLWLGTEQQLPPLTTLETILPPLQLALHYLDLKAKEHHSDSYHRLLANIHQLIDDEPNTPKLLERAIAATQKFFQADQGIVALLKYENPLHYRRDQITCPTATLNLSHSVTGLPEHWSLQECDFCQQAWIGAPEIWRSQDIADDLWHSPLLVPKYRSLLIAPLMGRKASEIYGNTVLGFVIFAHHTPRFWQEQDAQIIKIIAHQLSTTMIHHQALRQVQSLVDERTAQLKWSLDVQAKLGAKMRQQIQQLRQLNVLKDEFLSTMSHELNTPLATMKMAVKMLKQPGRSPEKQATYLDILDQELIRESKLIKDLLKLQHFESEQFTLKPQRLTLQPLLSKMQQEFDHRWQPLKGIQLQLSFLPENIAQKLQMETDEESFSNAISELLVNAGKYSAPDTIVKLEVEYLSKSPAKIQIRICNDGSGISPEEQEHIFEKFRRGAGVTDKAIPGTGLGLALVKALVEQLEGTIAVSSEPNSDNNYSHTCFTLVFPQSLVSI